MFNKILIANRGEIAVRVIRACREMGIRTVAVHSDIDRECLHVKLADESVCIGPSQPQESYLNIANIISAAEITGADAIHPGYGFLSENTYFADVCESCNIKFIGPSKSTIQLMGDKSEAKKTMKKAGVPTIPGTEGCITADHPKLFKIAKNIGYPIIVKACAGGGGKGMRIVTSEDTLKNAILTAEAEAKAAFNNGDVYLEKYIEEPKHIEFQILGDKKGDVVSFPERDCSIQRRHQKLIEESPSLISEKLSKKMGHAARLAAKAVKYVTAGTIEFLVDKKGNFYFMEMNTRIQVEHPVTEMVSGIDLLKEQIRLAAGEQLGYSYDDIEIKGHVIECRINAEDSENNFIPSPGKINSLILPGGMGVRIDSHIYSGYTIPSTYDSLIAKLLVIDSTRQKAIARMQRALSEFEISGIKTTIPFHKITMANDFFKKGEIYTNFIQKRIFIEK
ncbi:MAG: acetyl-CoA carboxylase biotin carboxylase subunit [Elusimicrobia bacterium RIFOXYD2_FULL_34_30]|nr:MAG: acetyl-CoA carboxylase biotin carboxylase subunit [Elusimicrobia bacterium RIFOXYD2_FULL_34_30]